MAGNKTKKIVSATIAFPAPYTAFSLFTATIFTIPGRDLVAGGTLSMLIRRLNTADTYTGSVGVVQALYRSNTV